MKIEITSLRVVGCGPLQDVRIDFTNREGKPLPVVLLAGANGSGKTTVLEVMFGLFQLLEPKLNQVPDILKRCLYAIMNCTINDTLFSLCYGEIGEDEKALLHEEKVQGYESLVAMNQERNKPDYSPDNMEALTFHSKGTALTKKVQNGMIESPFVLAKQHIWSAEKDNPFEYAPSILYFPYQRAIEFAEGQEIRREQTQYQWTYKYETVKSFAGSLSSYLVWLDYAEPETFQSVKAFLDNLYPDNKSFEINRRDLKAVVRVASGFVHDVDKLSSGEQNLLIMLLELRRRLLPGSIVLIDELENSLHTAFQHRLAQGLLQLQREIPFQLVATTHAETFVDIFGTKATRILPVPPAVPAAEPTAEVK